MSKKSTTIAALFLLLSSQVLLARVDDSKKNLDEVSEYIQGHILVKVKSGEINSLEAVAKTVGAKKTKSFYTVKGLSLYEFDSSLDVEDVQNIFEESNSVEYAEPDYIYKEQASVNDPEYVKQWALNNSGQNEGLIGADINAEAMWDLEKGKKSIVIAIIDTGVDYTHPDLKDNIWTNTSEIAANGIDDDKNGYVDDIHGINAILGNGDPKDDNVHGTHVAGIIGGKGNNTLGISGVAQEASIAACKFLNASGSGGISDAIECMDYFAKLKSRAQNPVNIVATNNSWGGGSSSQSMKDAITTHKNLGILFIAAAGNERKNNDIFPSYPSSYNIENVISVASTDKNDKLSTFSNYGKKTVHVAAPGTKILSTALNNSYRELSGTSMATPHVTGLTAIIYSHFPDISYKQAKNLIMTGGEVLESTKNSVISGRRISGAGENGIGSLSCVDQTIKIRQEPVVTTQSIAVNSSLFLSANYINCDSNGVNLIVYSDETTTITLTDAGINGDKVANDGIFSLNWQPTIAGVYELNFGDDDKITVTVLEDTAPAKLYKPYKEAYNFGSITATKFMVSNEATPLTPSRFIIPFLGNRNRFYTKELFSL